MKYLSDYLNPKVDELSKKYGTFYAFTDKQFKEKGKDSIIYVSLGGGLICPKQSAEDYLKEFITVLKESIELDIKENGINNIIARELSNYECYYTGDWKPAYEALEEYPNITEELVRDTYFKTRG